MAQWRLSSFSRSLSDGTWVTRGLLCPSGVLWSGKAQGKSWVSPRPPLLPCLESWGAVFPRPAGSIPPAYPSSVSTHCSFRAQELQKERRHSVRPRSPQPVGRGGCLHTPTPWGRAQGQDGAPRGGAEVLPKPWLPLSCHPAHTDAFALPFWGPKGGQGMQEVAMPPSLPAGVLPVPWPGSARRAEATHRVAWAQLGTSPARPWDVAPRLTQSRNAGASGPGEDEGGPALIAAFLFLVSRCPFWAAEHPQLVQGHAELWAQGGATSAEGRRGQ